jgi:hypothetical protein
MKKFTVSFLVFLCLLININTLTSLAQGNTFKEGFYKVSNLNFSPNVIYNIQNISPDKNAYVFVFDNNAMVYQTIRLSPRSPKYQLLLLKPSYNIIVVGEGEVFIS